MEKLVLHPTPESQWYALVEEACRSSAIPLSEDLESYLVFLLMRFTKNPEIAYNIFALDYLEGIKNLNPGGRQTLRDVGDKCLLFSGFFPQRARHRRVNISYYVKLGQSAYSSLSNHTNQLSELFSKLHDHFVPLMDILHAIRALDKNYKILDLLDAYELWSDTKSAQAFKILQGATQHTSPNISPTPFNSAQKH